MSPTPPPVAAAPATQDSVDAFLVWDAVTKAQTVTNGTPEAQFTFNLTNIASSSITISNASASCGCTVAQLPKVPWTLEAGTHGDIHVTMNLAGKSGTISKDVTLVTDQGIKKLFVATTIQAAVLPKMTEGDRAINQKLALADRQAVFKGECAQCHVEPVKGKWGKELYDTACGICHDAEHRATMVPDLRKLPQAINADYWRNIVAHGKPNSLMPAFAMSEGGILSDLQINSLVSYLALTIPPAPAAPGQPHAPQTPPTPHG